MQTIKALVSLLALSVAAPGIAGAIEPALPPSAEGTFVQRKELADVEVTLVSKGRFRFVRDKFFEWETLEPVKSVFHATPTNYSISVNGRTSSRALNVDITSVAKIFELKEMKEYVEKVETEPAAGFPRTVRVKFKNGDRLEMELKCER